MCRADTLAHDAAFTVWESATRSDLGATVHYAAVPPGRDLEGGVRGLGTFSRLLLQRVEATIAAGRCDVLTPLISEAHSIQQP
mgnify:CR=1 FL=1